MRGLMRGLLARARALVHWFRFLARLRDLERTLGMLKACPGCGEVILIGHPAVKTIELGPDVVLPVCKWCRGTIVERLKGQKKRA